jgi:hypothetical protein
MDGIIRLSDRPPALQGGQQHGKRGGRKNRQRSDDEESTAKPSESLTC